MGKKRKKTKLKENFLTLPNGTDFASLQDVVLYGQYIFSRKVLVVDVKIPSKKTGKETIRLINTHLSSYSTTLEENRELRTEQAKFICNNALKGNKWKWAIIGMDMNDVPGDNLVYKTFVDSCGFYDSFNPDASDMVNYPYTYSTDNNTWTTDYYEKVTIDYLMAKGNTYHPKGTIQLKVNFSD